jgi:hypothetical protein
MTQCTAILAVPPTDHYGTAIYLSCELKAGHDGNHQVLASGKEWKNLDAPADQINHPKHYNSHPSGVECITIAEHHNFNIGNVLKYLWRAGLKPTGQTIDVTTFGSEQQEYVLPSPPSDLVDLKKAQWYLNREISRLEGTKS